MTPAYTIQQGTKRGLFPTERTCGGDRLRWVGGRPGVDLESRWIFTLSRGDECLWEVAVLFEEQGGPFVSAVVWEEAGVVLVGGEATVFALDLASGTERLHFSVDMYFGYFALDPEREHLYVLGGRDIHRFDRGLNRLWTSESIAVDGITSAEFSGPYLHVSAEMDPPGGWVPVTLDVMTGRTVSGPSP